MEEIAPETLSPGPAGVAVPAKPYPSRRRQPPDVIGPAMRQAHERAIAADPQLTGRDMRVLLALSSLTLAYHRLVDRIHNAQLVDAAQIDRRHVYESLKRLRDAGVIVWEPSRGRNPALLGFPPAGGTVTATGDGSTVTARGDGSDPATVTANGGSTVTADGDTAVKESSDKSSAAAARAEARKGSADQENLKSAVHGEGQEEVVVELGGSGAGRENLGARAAVPEALAALVAAAGEPGRSLLEAAVRDCPDDVAAEWRRLYGDEKVRDLTAALIGQVTKRRHVGAAERERAAAAGDELADAIEEGVEATCPVCRGEGATPGAGGVVPCSVCRSTGRTNRACPKCQGALEVDGEPCDDCEGTGLWMLSAEWDRLRVAPQVALWPPGWGLLVAGQPLPRGVVPDEHVAALQAAGFTVLDLDHAGAAACAENARPEPARIPPESISGPDATGRAKPSGCHVRLA